MDPLDPRQPYRRGSDFFRSASRSPPSRSRPSSLYDSHDPSWRQDPREPLSPRDPAYPLFPSDLSSSASSSSYQYPLAPRFAPPPRHNAPPSAPFSAPAPSLLGAVDSRTLPRPPALDGPLQHLRLGSLPRFAPFRRQSLHQLTSEYTEYAPAPRYRDTQDVRAARDSRGTLDRDIFAALTMSPPGGYAPLAIAGPSSSGSSRRKHGFSESEDGAVPVKARRRDRKPRRITLGRGEACQGCRVRKLKCGNNKPCDNCVKAHIPCQFEEPSQRKTKTAQMEETIENLKAEIEGLQNPQTLAGTQAGGAGDAASPASVASELGSDPALESMLVTLALTHGPFLALPLNRDRFLARLASSDPMETPHPALVAIVCATASRAVEDGEPWVASTLSSDDVAVLLDAVAGRADAYLYRAQVELSDSLNHNDPRVVDVVAAAVAIASRLLEANQVTKAATVPFARLAGLAGLTDIGAGESSRPRILPRPALPPPKDEAEARERVEVFWAARALDMSVALLTGSPPNMPADHATPWPVGYDTADLDHAPPGALTFRALVTLSRASRQSPAATTPDDDAEHATLVEAFERQREAGGPADDRLAAYAHAGLVLAHAARMLARPAAARAAARALAQLAGEERQVIRPTTAFIFALARRALGALANKDDADDEAADALSSVLERWGQRMPYAAAVLRDLSASKGRAEHDGQAGDLPDGADGEVVPNGPAALDTGGQDMVD
ncbi:hypothetical protein Q5752_005429 [Cryptotrichosporon argae]